MLKSAPKIIIKSPSLRAKRSNPIQNSPKIPEIPSLRGFEKPKQSLGILKFPKIP